MLLLPPEENEEDESCQLDTILPELNISTHLLAIIDLFLLYNKCFPHALDVPSSINFLTDIEQILANEGDHEVVAVVQEKVLELLITLDSFAFTPDKVNTIQTFIIISLRKTVYCPFILMYRKPV
jgi:hypothetical protein